MLLFREVRHGRRASCRQPKAQRTAGIRNASLIDIPDTGARAGAVRETEIAGHYIPAGTPCDLAYGVNHMLPELWTSPERFDPERFAEHRREYKSHRLAWLPFGAGAHKCIGMHT
jgi:cytochrome P450